MALMDTKMFSLNPNEKPSWIKSVLFTLCMLTAESKSGFGLSFHYFNVDNHNSRALTQRHILTVWTQLKGRKSWLQWKRQVFASASARPRFQSTIEHYSIHYSEAAPQNSSLRHEHLLRFGYFRNTLLYSECLK